MKRTFIIAAFALMASVSALVSPASAKSAQNKEADRIETRDKLRRLLEVAGQEKGINIPFRQSDKQPFNFIGVKRDGLTNADLFEIVISVSDQQTIHFRVYPHYKDGYINVDKVKNSSGLMRLLLNFSDRNFLIAFLTNAGLAMGLVWVGDQLGLDFTLPIVVVLGIRIFSNVAAIRRRVFGGWLPVVGLVQGDDVCGAGHRRDGGHALRPIVRPEPAVPDLRVQPPEQRRDRKAQSCLGRVYLGGSRGWRDRRHGHNPGGGIDRTQGGNNSRLDAGDERIHRVRL